MSEAIAETLPASSKAMKRARVRAKISRILDSFIFYSLLAVIALTAIPYGTVQPWWEALFESATFALASLAAVDVMLRGFDGLARYKLLLPLLALVVFALLQSMLGISADPFETRLFVLKVAAICLTLALLIRYTKSRRRLAALIILILSVAVACALFGIIRQSTQHEGSRFVLPYLIADLGYAQFINKNHFAFLMEMALGLALGFLVAGGASRDRALIYLAAAAPVWIGLVLCRSRGGILSMFSQIIFLALLFNLTRTRAVVDSRHDSSQNLLLRAVRSTVFRVVLIVGLVAAVFIGMVWVGGENLVRGLQSMPGEVSQNRTEAGASRLEIWRTTWRMFEDHPVSGVGFNGYWIGITQYHEASGRLTPQQAHNDYLEILASGGLIGMAIFIWFVVLFVREVKRTFTLARDRFARACIIGACAGIFGVAVHSFVDFGLHITINSLVFVSLLAMATNRIDAEKRAHEV